MLTERGQSAIAALLAAAEEIVDLWNVLFPADRNVWYDEQEDKIHYTEELVGYAEVDPQLRSATQIAPASRQGWHRGESDPRYRVSGVTLRPAQSPQARASGR